MFQTTPKAPRPINWNSNTADTQYFMELQIQIPNLTRPYTSIEETGDKNP